MGDGEGMERIPWLGGWGATVYRDAAISVPRGGCV